MRKPTFRVGDHVKILDIPGIGLVRDIRRKPGSFYELHYDVRIVEDGKDGHDSLVGLTYYRPATMLRRVTPLEWLAETGE